MTQTPPGVIPYVEHHDGPKRLLRVDLTTGNLAVAARTNVLVPVVCIDGRRYTVFWGSVMFEIPADRACHVSVHIEADYLQQQASLLLPPAADPVALHYTTDWIGGAGSLAPAP